MMPCWQRTGQTTRKGGQYDRKIGRGQTNKARDMGQHDESKELSAKKKKERIKDVSLFSFAFSFFRCNAAPDADQG